MNEGLVPSQVHVGAMASVCEDTENGWLWYCDVHDTHGNADQEDEAILVAGAHVNFYSSADQDDECDIMIWFRVPLERAGRVI